LFHYKKTLLFFCSRLTQFKKKKMAQSLDDVWVEAQTWERAWWMGATGQHEAERCKNGIVAQMLNIRDVSKLRVLDIGCGPFSLLQRFPAQRAVAVDPLHFGEYEGGYAGIERVYTCGEDIDESLGEFDEVWIYNCLQHVKDPARILHNASRLGKRVRLFEWTYIPPYTGHLHMLTPDLLKASFAHWNILHEANGILNHSGLEGRYYLGVFDKKTA
jgi:SAM-dependent methyltransferase